MPSDSSIFMNAEAAFIKPFIKTARLLANGYVRLRRLDPTFWQFFADLRTNTDVCGPGVGGAGGIRTLDTVLPYTHFPGERLRPLGHRSANRWKGAHVGKELRSGNLAGVRL